MDTTVHVCIGIDHNHDADSAFENGSELPNIMELSSGIMIGEVVNDSPAERAGIQSGDIIMAIDGIPVEDARDLARLIRSKANKSVELAVKRESQTITVFATIGTRR
jgi:serine protease Do